jgi:DTW domain-containing protein YfiP
VVFLQHPRESRVAIGTARMAHLGLSNSELHEGIEFASNARINELIERPGTAVLFPGEGSVAPDELDQPPETLLVIDGTWPQARKLFALNPALQRLPRIGFVPKRPGNYRIRREPADHCMATIEAVVEVLAAFERDGTRFESLIQTFERMVDRQITFAAARTQAPRRNERPPDPWWISPAMPDLAALWPDLIAVACEANAHGRDSHVPGSPELIQLAAVRLATGDIFHAFVAARRPLAPRAHMHLHVQPADLENGRVRWTPSVGPISVEIKLCFGV